MNVFELDRNLYSIIKDINICIYPTTVGVKKQTKQNWARGEFELHTRIYIYENSGTSTFERSFKDSTLEDAFLSFLRYFFNTLEGWFKYGYLEVIEND